MAAYKLTLIVQDPATGYKKRRVYDFDSAMPITGANMGKVVTWLQAAVTDLSAGATEDQLP